MRYDVIYILLALLTILGCGEVEEDYVPSAQVEIVEIPEQYYENSTLFYKPTTEQIIDLLNLDYPINWYEEKDIELHAKYYYAMLLQEYGDIPAVHIEAQSYKLDLLHQGRPIEMTSDDLILSLKAKYILWPNPNNLSVLNRTITVIEDDIILENTEDPDIFVKIYTRQLIGQHGDIPEVYIVVEGERKMRFGGFRVVTDGEKEEYIQYLRAKHVLQPTEYNMCLLNAHIEAKENGTAFHLIEHDCVEGTLDEIILGF